MGFNCGEEHVLTFSADEVINVTYDLASWEIEPFKNFEYRIEYQDFWSIANGRHALILSSKKFFGRTVSIPSKFWLDKFYGFRRSIIHRSASVYIDEINRSLASGHKLDLDDQEGMSKDAFHHWFRSNVHDEIIEEYFGLINADLVMNS